jgi:hypothetical protein
MEPTATIVRQYISDAGLTGGGKHSYPLFPNRHGERLTRALNVPKTDENEILPIAAEVLYFQ